MVDLVQCAITSGWSGHMTTGKNMCSKSGAKRYRIYNNLFPSSMSLCLNDIHNNSSLYNTMTTSHITVGNMAKETTLDAGGCNASMQTALTYI